MAGQFERLAEVLASGDSDGSLDPARVTHFSARVIGATQHCGLTLLRPRARPNTVGATDQVPRQVDALQYSLDEGPCLDAAERDTLVVADDLGTDQRWPRFGPRCVAEVGVQSMLAVRLMLTNGDQAAMNLYSRQTSGFDEDDIALATVLAPFAALAVEHQLRQGDIEHLKAALDTSRQISTAVGILMARHVLDSQEAFALLTTTSQRLNRKLRDIAQEVEFTGQLPAHQPRRT